MSKAKSKTKSEPADRKKLSPSAQSAASSTRLALPRQPPSAKPLKIAVSNTQKLLKVSPKRLIHAAQTALRDEHVGTAEISVAIVDDARIHEINREFLQHDYPTDVISFDLAEPRQPAAPSRTARNAPPGVRRSAGLAISGEVVVSAETALRLAEQFGWTAQDEIVLYLVHGLLHLCGYDDLTEKERLVMRRRETEVLALLGLVPRYDHRA